MMTKSTSLRRALCKEIALVPLSAAAIFMFSIKTIAQETANSTKPEQKEVQSTKEGVSQELLNEYEAIVNKNKSNRKSTDTTSPAISKADRERLETIFFGMSKEQQAKQTVTFGRPTPFPKNKPAEEQFKAFKNPKKYAINIDNKKVDNTELNKFQPSDFAHFTVFYRAKTNRDYGKHLPLDVYLVTKEYSEAFAKKISAGDMDIMITKYTFKKAVKK